MKISGDYIKYKQDLPQSIEEIELDKKIIALFMTQEEIKFKIMHYTAKLWAIIDKHALNKFLEPNNNELINYINKFRTEKKLFTQELLQQWLMNNNLTLDSFKELMQMALRFDFFIIRNNIDVLDVQKKNDETCWFLDALYLSGIYTLSKNIVMSREKCNELKSAIKSQIVAQSSSFINGLDFHDMDAVETFIEALHPLSATSTAS